MSSRLREYNGQPRVGRTIYRSLAQDEGTPTSTYWHRQHGRRTIRHKAISQQYLTPYEEEALVQYALRCGQLGYPVPAKTLPSLAAVIKSRRRSHNAGLSEDEKAKPPSQKWVQGFYKRHPEVTARKVKPIDWTRHEHTIYNKTVDWFALIEKVIRDVRPENLYNMDETGVQLGVPHAIKVLLDSKDRKKVRGVGLNRDLVTAIECISADGRSLPPLIIWPAASHRSNWTVHPTPGWHYACTKTG